MADFTNKTFEETYRDFWKEEDGYHRVLFNSGRALQARELIESQTIIQEEIARFGRNIFKEGALVNPGGATVDNRLEYIRLDAVSILSPDLLGKTLTNGTLVDKGIEVKVVEVVEATATDPATLYVQYMDTSVVTDNTVAPRISALDTLVALDGTVSSSITVAADGAIPATGRGTKAYFAAGDFFVQGHFVYMEGGSSFIDKYSALPTVDVGFRIVQTIITEGEDDSLYDNQGEVPNATAPGAHRYQIKLTPTTREQVEEEENFVFIARVVDGVITREVSTFDAYNRINDLLAQRTKEESGDYVVEQFKAIFEELDDTNLNLDVTEGIAYVDGYRLEIGTTDITVPKARDTIDKTNENVEARFGNYVYIDADNCQGIGRLDVFGYVRIKNVTNDVIGYANIRAIEQDATGYRAYLFNILMNGIFDQTGRIGTESFSDAVELDDPLSGDVLPLINSNLYATADNNLLFPLPSKSPTKDAITANYTIQVYHEVTANSSGEITIAGTEYSSWVIAEDAGPILPITTTNGTYTGLTAGGNYKILSFEEVTSAPRKKTITAATVTQDIPTVDWERRPITLDVADAIEIQSVQHKLLATDDWEDITYQFTLDGGQRDNFYDNAQVLIKPGYNIPSGGESQVKVEFTYYVHENIGQYFAANSYDLDDYDEIPSHTTATGEVISLRDVLDFRPVRKPTSSYTNEFDIFPLPQNSSAITINNMSYYLPRIDILVANAIDSRGDIGFGELQVVQGEPAESPREPEVPTGSLALYKFKLNPYTFGVTDLSSTYIPNKRFTMKDISKLSERVEDLYELTTLSLLETNTNTLNVLDDNGLSRTKSGFIADNFTNFDFSDIDNQDYRASIDPNGRLKPSFRESSVRMVYSTNNTTSITKKGDLVTLPYTDVSLVSQLLATSTMNVNPFAVITQTGHMNLSPSSDEWVETRDLPPIMQTTIRRFDETRMEDFDTRPALRSGRLSNNASNSGLFTTIPRDVSFRTASRSIQEFIGEQVANVEIVPFMRSRRINFTVKGLRPNTKMFAFFGGVDVNAWVRQEVTATNFSDDTQEFGSQYANATGYPAVLGGSTTLETDSKGEIIGTFFLPNTSAINFRTGTQEFKLLDVSVDDETEALCSTRASYTSTGKIENVQRTVRSTRLVGRRAGRRDPLAQTFFVDQIENPNGMFLTKARIFVETVDQNIPLQVQIRSVENGIPTNIILPGAVKFIDPADITVATNPETIEDVQAAATIVEFDEPIYLTSGEEYAIILLAESVEYNVYIAETYKNVFGSREDTVSKQPTLGSLFLSQNGFTWTPDQTKDLMFELDRADFSASGTLLLDNAPLPKVTLGTDPFETTSGSSLVTVSHEGHGFTSGDTVSISDVTNGTGGLLTSDLEGLFQVINPTWEGYTIDVTTLASGSSVGGGNDVTASQQVMFDQFVPLIQTLTPNTTTVVAQGSTTEGSSYGSGRSSGTPSNLYNSTGNQLVFLNDININTTPKVVSTEDNAGTSPNLSLSITLATQDSKVSPIVDLQRTSVLTLENVIGLDDSAQHITTPTVVDESSVGLKIIFAANRPSTSEFDVYIRTAADEDSLNQVDSEGDSVIDWVLVPTDKIIPSDEDPEVFRDYEYTVDADLFSVFQVKIEMKSTNSSKSPIIRDLRVIALVV